MKISQKIFTFFATVFRNVKTSSSVYKVEDLEGFKKAQRMAYECVTQVALKLKPGMTEKEAANLLSKHLNERGFFHYLHRPFAWFGEHSRFDTYEKSFNCFHPSDRVLKDSDVVILDVSPIVGGYIGDVGYTFSLKENAELKKAQNFLLLIRQKLPLLFSSDKSLSMIWSEIEATIKTEGYDNCHALYPLRVLGHRIYKIPKWMLLVTLPRIPLGVFGLSWFSLQGLMTFMKFGLIPEVLGPENNGPKSGLWAIEPHIGAKGFGAKFEEILVVEKSGSARWLDTEVPHNHHSK